MVDKLKVIISLLFFVPIFIGGVAVRLGRDKIALASVSFILFLFGLAWLAQGLQEGVMAVVEDLTLTLLGLGIMAVGLVLSTSIAMWIEHEFHSGFMALIVSGLFAMVAVIVGMHYPYSYNRIHGKQPGKQDN